MFGKDRHSTYLGALCTVAIYTFITIMSFYTLFLFDKSSQDLIYTSNLINTYDNPNPGIKLNQTGQSFLNFDVYINNGSFENEDNPYGQFLLHTYTNMDNIKDID